MEDPRQVADELNKFFKEKIDKLVQRIDKNRDP